MNIYRCDSCEYVYSESRGDNREGFPAGTAWEEVPDDWCCPDCGVRDKTDFIHVPEHNPHAQPLAPRSLV